MNSNISGERRWASARRGGMTVLGKVAVPKPLNLPSQKLENHGLDPNVEIVPKGTLSWGSRPSSSGSNPWITSSVSPIAEGGTVSPSHVSVHPSSGGSGTRPSTSGSERAHEPVSSAWGSNSRPSSASGTLSSKQTSSTSLRPRSAESRPNSSHLSRFAEPMSKNSTAWGPSGTSEGLGVKSSKNDEFALSSGDFPTLGCDQEVSMKNIELEDAKHEALDTWRADGLQSVKDGTHPSMEKWNEDNSSQYFNPNAAPQHFDTWRGPPPMNGSAGVWYGGARPQGLPYGPLPVRPRGFSMEPFPYYHPQIVPATGPMGPHPKNGDLYRPRMPDAYAHPGMPFRPGFYTGPAGPRGPVAFEGYYGPPMGSERDITYMGMATGPPVYNSSYPGPSLGIVNSHGRDGRGHHPGKTSSEQVDVNRVDAQEPKRIHLKSHHNHHDHPCDLGETWERNPQPDVSYPDRNRSQMVTSQKNEWGAEDGTEESVHAERGTPSEKTSRSSDYRVHSMDGVIVKPSEEVANAKAVHDNWVNTSDGAPSFPAETSQLLLTGSKNSGLLRKIDSLNAKIRVSDGQKVSPHSHNREAERNRSQVIDAKVDNNMGEVNHAVGSLEMTPGDSPSGPHEVIVSASNKPLQQVTVMSRRPHHGGRGRIDHRGKASHDESEELGPGDAEASENSVSSPLGKTEEPLVDTHDSSDFHVQRAKMRELAKQRALQLQKEEEERIKEQKAKALAKLEELNRRTFGEDGSGKIEKSQVINDNPEKRDESHVVSEPLIPNFNNTDKAEESVVETPRTLPIESDVTTLPMCDDTHDASARKATLQFNDGGLSRHKRMSYRQKQNCSLQKSFTEKPVSDVTAQMPGDHTVSANDITLSEHPSSEINIANIVSETSVPLKRKNSRSVKNKHKQDETTLPPVEANIYTRKESVEKVVTQGSLSNLDTSVYESVETDKAVKAHDGLSSVPNEESRSRVSSQWRPHSSHRQPRNQQANKKPHGVDAVWTPVSTLNKATKSSVEESSNSVHELANPTEGNNHTTHNNLKGKRAEMERYVPKPVAKGLAQQGNVLNLSSNVASSKSDEGWDGVVNDEDVTCSKNTKDQRTWKQSSTTNSSHMKGVHLLPPSTYEPVKEIQEPKEMGQSVKSGIDTLNAEIKTSGTGRGKRSVARNPATSMVKNLNPDKAFSGEVDGIQPGRTIESKENLASSHWKPKPSSNAANNRSLTTKISRPIKEQHPQAMGKGGNSSQAPPGQPVNHNSNFDQDSPSVGHRQEIEKKAKGRLYIPNQDPVVPNEAPPPPPAVKVDVHVKYPVGSASRRNGKHNNNRSVRVRGHDNNNALGDWNSGHDNIPYNNASPSIDNRPRHNTHYEYQPVGPFRGNNRPEKFDEAVNGADSTYRKHGERGRSHPRRGGSYNRRQNGPPAQVDVGWE